MIFDGGGYKSKGDLPVHILLTVPFSNHFVTGSIKCSLIFVGAPVSVNSNFISYLCDFVFQKLIVPIFKLANVIRAGANLHT